VRGERRWHRRKRSGGGRWIEKGEDGGGTGPLELLERYRLVGLVCCEGVRAEKSEGGIGGKNMRDEGP
jgi:hypothetical protein